MATLQQALLAKAVDAADPDDDLAAEAKPLPERAKRKVEAKDVPLPPAHLVDDLDNSKQVPVASEPDDEPVTLDFVGDDLPVRKFTLRYPFRWQGEVHGEVTVRQLTTAEVGQIASRWSGGKAPELYDIYAVMSGLPAKVLRALPAVDGEPIVDAAFDFLPRLFRPGDA